MVSSRNWETRESSIIPPIWRLSSPKPEINKHPAQQESNNSLTYLVFQIFVKKVNISTKSCSCEYFKEREREPSILVEPFAVYWGVASLNSWHFCWGPQDLASLSVFQPSLHTYLYQRQERWEKKKAVA